MKILPFLTFILLNTFEKLEFSFSTAEYFARAGDKIWKELVTLLTLDFKCELQNSAAFIFEKFSTSQIL